MRGKLSEKRSVGVAGCHRATEVLTGPLSLGRTFTNYPTFSFPNATSKSDKPHWLCLRLSWNDIVAQFKRRASAVVRWKSSTNWLDIGCAALIDLFTPSLQLHPLPPDRSILLGVLQSGINPFAAVEFDGKCICIASRKFIKMMQIFLK